MSTKRQANIAQLDSFILKLNTGQREDLIGRQSPEDQEAIREALAQGKTPPKEEEKIAPPPPENAQEAIEQADRVAKGKEEKKKEQVFRAEVAGRMAERKRSEAAITATDRFAQKAFNLGNGVFHGSKGWLEGRPTPGGIGVPLAILLFFFFLLLPVNGHTRLMWLWLTLTGNAEIGGPLPPPTLTPQTPPVNQTSPFNLVGAVVGFEQALFGLLGGPTQTTTSPAGTTVAKGATGSFGHRGPGSFGNPGTGQKNPPINQQQASNAQKNQMGMHGPHGGGPDHLSNLNGHAKSYGDLLQSLGD